MFDLNWTVEVIVDGGEGGGGGGRQEKVGVISVTPAPPFYFLLTVVNPLGTNFFLFPTSTAVINKDGY